MTLRHPRDADVTYFWHIPKTAGTAFIHWLDEHFEAPAIFPGQLLSQLDSAEQRLRLTSCRLVRGHLADAPLQLLGSKICTITILREPLQRSASHLAHVDRDTNHPVHERLRFYSGDLDRALADPVVRGLVQNVQTRYLGLRWSDDLQDEYRVVPDHHPLSAAMAFEFAAVPGPQRLLPRALLQLARIAYVGTTDRLHETAARIAHDRGYQDRPVATANVRPKKQSAFRLRSLTSSQVARLRQLNHLDYVLWRAAQARQKLARELP